MHINEMLNKKTYIGGIEPNPKEFGIWIKNDGSHKMYDYNTHQWVCTCDGGTDGSPEPQILEITNYFSIEGESVEFVITILKESLMGSDYIVEFGKYVTDSDEWFELSQTEYLSEINYAI